MSYALVTGASSRIGKEFALQLAKKGYDLVLVARNEKKLEELAKEVNVNVLIFSVDLSSEKECVDLLSKLENIDIEIVINNAGFGECGEFKTIETSLEMNMIDVNIKAVHLITKYFVRKLSLKDFTYILNVASIAGLFPSGPYMATYYATKAYVTSLTQAVAKELKDNGSKLYIGALCPGPVNTEFNRVANVKFSLKGINADKCVEYALKKMFKRKQIIIPTFKLKCAYFVQRLLPKKTIIYFMSKQQKRKLYK